MRRRARSFVWFRLNRKRSRRPTGPQDQKRPADVIGNAGHVIRVATSEIEEATEPDDGDRSTTNFRVGPVAGYALTLTEPGRRVLCEGSCFVCCCRAVEPPSKVHNAR